MSAPWIVAFIALWATVLVFGLIVLGTLRRLAPLIERAEASLAAAQERAAPRALPVGESVPTFLAETVDGATFTDADLREARTVVLFLGASCSACGHLVRDVELGQPPDLGSRLVIVSDRIDEARRFARSPDVTVVFDLDRSLAEAFESEIVPHAFVVENGMVLASGRPNTWDGMRDLIGARKGGDHQPDIAAEVATSRR
jgi:hypothetical protein